MAEPSCSFCGKHQGEVRALMAAPASFICDACVELMADICELAIPWPQAPIVVDPALAAEHARVLDEKLAGIKARHAERRKQAPSAAAVPPPPEFHCSFCGKTRSQVKKLISGPGVFICDGCVTTCIGALTPKLMPSG